MTACKTIKVHELTFKLMISEREVQNRVKAMGALLQEKFKGKNPLFLGVLNGSFIFMSDLTRAFGEKCEMSFVKLSSYRGLASTGEVTTLIGLTADVTNRHIVIVEDIIDTGKTAHDFLLRLKEMQPSSITFVSFLLKPDALQYDIPLDYVGFKIPNKFVVGYGMDYNEQGRNLGGVYQLKAQS